MKMSKRALRMEQHHKRTHRSSGINLVSLMDIFTILVFFLLVNSTDGEVLPNSKNIDLPESVVEHKARESVLVLVSEKEIQVQGHTVAGLDTLEEDGEALQLALAEALAVQREQVRTVTVEGEEAPHEVTIMGDKAIPYKVLKQVMRRASEVGFERISLAVLQTAGPVATAGPQG